LLAPAHVGVINQLSLVLIELPEEEHRQQALQYAELGAKLNPNQHEALITLGWVNYRLNRRREAEQAFTAAMTRPDGSKIDTMNSDMAYYLSLMAKEQGNVPEAINMLRDALNTDMPFAYRKQAGELLAQLSKGDSSQQKTKSDRGAETSKSVDPASKASATK
jgi:tetratricopeptide (TPR) repeat protein